MVAGWNTSNWFNSVAKSIEEKFFHHAPYAYPSKSVIGYTTSGILPQPDQQQVIRDVGKMGLIPAPEIWAVEEHRTSQC